MLWLMRKKMRMSSHWVFPVPTFLFSIFFLSFCTNKPVSNFFSIFSDEVKNGHAVLLVQYHSPEKVKAIVFNDDLSPKIIDADDDFIVPITDELTQAKRGLFANPYVIPSLTDGATVDTGDAVLLIKNSKKNNKKVLKHISRYLEQLLDGSLTAEESAIFKQSKIGAQDIYRFNQYANIQSVITSVRTRWTGDSADFSDSEWTRHDTSGISESSYDSNFSSRTATDLDEFSDEPSQWSRGSNETPSTVAKSRTAETSYTRSSQVSTVKVAPVYFDTFGDQDSHLYTRHSTRGSDYAFPRYRSRPGIFENIATFFGLGYQAEQRRLLRYQQNQKKLESAAQIAREFIHTSKPTATDTASIDPSALRTIRKSGWVRGASSKVVGGMVVVGFLLVAGDYLYELFVVEEVRHGIPQVFSFDRVPEL